MILKDQLKCTDRKNKKKLFLNLKEHNQNLTKYAKSQFYLE
jgi:hypothetical protein